MRMRVKKHICVQKHIPSVKKHPLAWFWVVLCVLILLESRVCDWTERLVAEKSSFEGSGSLQIEQAILFAGNAGESDSLYDLTVTLHNVGDTLEKYLPQLYVMESEQPDNSKMHLSLQPVSLYEEINAAGVNNYDIDLCIPPGQTVTVSYSVTVSDYQEYKHCEMTEKQYLFLFQIGKRNKMSACRCSGWK